MFNKKPEQITVDSILGIIDDVKVKKITKSTNTKINTAVEDIVPIKNDVVVYNKNLIICEEVIHVYPTLEDRFVCKDISWLGDS